MSITLGPNIDQQQANEWISNLARRLPGGEDLRHVSGAHPRVSFDLFAVTNQRVLAVSSRADYGIVFEFSVHEAARVYVDQDESGHSVHVPMAGGEHCILRPTDTVDGAGQLARAIHEALADARPAQGPEPLMPQDRGGSSIFEQAGLDYVQIIVPRDEIETGDITPTLAVLAPLLESKRTARAFMERVCIAFDGYNDTTWELFEIPEVRDYVQALDRRFPYWLYFLDKRTSSFDAMWRCFMPPDLTAAAQAEEFPRRLDPLLRNWWTPAMDSICEFVGMSERDHYNLCERYALYFQGRRDF